EAKVAGKKVGVWTVAGVTLANGGDNIGVYTPVFLSVEPLAVVAYCIVFLALVAALVTLAQFVATRPPIAEVLERWEHILFPILPIALGIVILVSGGAFGLCRSGSDPTGPDRAHPSRFRPRHLPAASPA